MYIKEKIKSHFLNLLEDKELAMLYFYNRDIVEEFNNKKLIDLENKVKKTENKYNKSLYLYYLVNFLGIESLVEKVSNNLLKVEKDYYKNMNQLDIFKSNLAYLIVSGILKLENAKIMGYSKEFIEQFIIPYQKQADNPYNEYFYNQTNGRTTMIDQTGFNVILPYTPDAVLRKFNKKSVDAYDSRNSLKKIYTR